VYRGKVYVKALNHFGLVMSAQDSFAIMYSAMAFGFLIFGMFTLVYVLGQSDQLMQLEGVEAALDALLVFDYLGVGVVVASTISSVFLASRIRANPLFLPISFVMLGFAVTVSYFLSLVPGAMGENMVVAEVFEMMGLTSLVLANLHVFVLISGLLGIVGTYALTGSSGSSGGGSRAPL